MMTASNRSRGAPRWSGLRGLSPDQGSSGPKMVQPVKTGGIIHRMEAAMSSRTVRIYGKDT